MEVSVLYDIKIGDHFWGMMDDKLAVFIKTKSGCYAAGEWECAIDIENIEFVSLIKRPNSVRKKELYYHY